MNTPPFAGTGPICARFKEKINAIFKVNKEENSSPNLSTGLIQSIFLNIKVLDQFVQDLRIEVKKRYTKTIKYRIDQICSNQDFQTL